MVLNSPEISVHLRSDVFYAMVRSAAREESVEAHALQCGEHSGGGRGARKDLADFTAEKRGGIATNSIHCSCQPWENVFVLVSIVEYGAGEGSCKDKREGGLWFCANGRGV